MIQSLPLKTSLVVLIALGVETDANLRGNRGAFST